MEYEINKLTQIVKEKNIFRMWSQNSSSLRLWSQ